MSIDADKLADIAIDAVFEDYEDTGIFSKERAKAAASKAIKAAVSKLQPGYGGFGVGGFLNLGDGVHVYRIHQWTRCVDPPLLPDGD